MKNVEDVYPLSPMQRVMLFHSIASTAGDTLFNQFRYQLDGDFDLDRLAAAWQSLVVRHPILRTMFVWEDLKDPLQVVKKEVELPVTRLDWSDRSDSEQESAFREFLEFDQGNRFQPSEAPLMRIACIRRGPRSAWMVWSSHHLLFDRWCLGTVFEDLFRLYAGERSLGRVHRFRDYVGWIGQQDIGAAESYWRSSLRGLTRPSRLTRAESSTGASGGIVERMEIGADRLEVLRAFARQHRLTLSNVVQGAWSLNLARWTESVDVVFGAAVAGRPPDLPGVESIVGSFVNNLPVRATLNPRQPIVEWLAEQRDKQQERIAHEYVSLADVHEWSDLPSTEPVFDHLLVWLAEPTLPDAPGFEMTGLPGSLATAYPLTLSVGESAESLSVEARCSAGHETVESLPEILQTFSETIDAMRRAVESSESAPLSQLPGFPSANLSARNERDGSTGSDSRGVVSLTSALEKAKRAVPAVEPVAGGREAIEESILGDIVLAEWREVLGVNQPGLDDNFFDLGGSSLAAAKLHARIVANTRLVVPVLSLFRTPTPRNMIATLKQRDWPLSSDVITPLRTQGSRSPLFCIASPEVSTVGYAMLARHLERDQPVYVVQTPPTTGVPKRMDPSDLLDLAEHYVAAVEALQPTGDVHLVGMCSGSHVALEMARKFEDRGRGLGLVSVINTWAFYTRPKSYRLLRFGLRAQYYVKRLRTLLSTSGVRHSARVVARKSKVLVGRRVAPLQAKTQGREVVTVPNPWLDEVGWERDDIGRPKFPGCVTVFRIRKSQVGRIRDHGLGWGKHAEHVQVEMLPGDDHDAILREPRVQELAARLQQSLDANRARSVS